MAQHPHRTLLRLLVCALLSLGAWPAILQGEAGVIVIANPTDADVHFVITPSDGEPQTRTLAAREVLPLFTGQKIEIALDAGGARRHYCLEVDSAHYFAGADGTLELRQIGSPDQPRESGSSGGQRGPRSRRPSVIPLGGVRSFYAMGIVPVAIYVDDEQQLLVREVWEERLRRRLNQASDIFERYCRIRFRVVKVGTWDSDDGIRQFPDATREFQKEVTPEPAALAIGFASQQYYLTKRRRLELGRAAGPLRRHVLIREIVATEPERLEVLVHELGHFLGAVHSADSYSVMRPSLGDGQVLERSFRIGFDPGNTLVMNLLAAELRTGAVVDLRELGDDTRRKLRNIYSAMDEALPDDPAARQCIELLDRSAQARPAPTMSPQPREPATGLLPAARAVRLPESRNRSTIPVTSALAPGTHSPVQRAPASPVTAWTRRSGILPLHRHA